MCRWRERTRQALKDGLVPLLTSVWLFAGAVLLPPALLLATVVTIFAADWTVYRVISRRTPYRYVYSAATIVLAAAACRSVMHALAWGSALTPLIYIVVNVCLVAMAMVASGAFAAIKTFAELSWWRKEAAVLVFGSVTALATTELTPLAGVAMVPLVIAMQHATLARQMRAHGLDPATGVFREPEWRRLAEHGLLETGRLALLVVRVADCTPAMLRSTGEVVSANSRPDLDFVCRYDEDSLAVAMPGVRVNPLAVIRRNIQTALAATGITTAVGIAACEMGGSDLPDALMHALGQLLGADIDAGGVGQESI